MTTARTFFWIAGFMSTAERVSSRFGADVGIGNSQAAESARTSRNHPTEHSVEDLNP